MLISFSAWFFFCNALLWDISNAFPDFIISVTLYHAILFDRPYLMDLDSTNGTFINVRFLVICVLICQIYWSRFDSSIL